MSLSEQRKVVRQLIDDTNPKDAPTAYYALFHEPKRSALFTATDGNGKATGFVGRFQTGMDLFRPLVTLVVRNGTIADELLPQALVPGRPYILFANLNQLPMLNQRLHIENQRILQIYRLEVTRFQPQMNVLVVRKRSPTNTPVCEINSHGVKATAGVNWQSPGFAEVYVQVDEPARQRGWGKSVLAAVIDEVLREGRRPIYLFESRNEASRRLSESLGFVDTGYRQVYADAIFQG